MPDYVRILGLILGGLFAGGVLAQDPGASGRAVRPEIGRPVTAAVELLKNKKGKEALAKLREAQAVRDKTPYESYVVERVVGQAFSAVGEVAAAARAFEAVASSTSASERDRRQFLAAAANQYYAARDYAKAAEVAARYFKEGGTEKTVRTVFIQALYLGNNFAAAAKALSADIEAEQLAGGVVAEERLQLLAQANLQTHDALGYTRALEKLLAHYPKRDYWLSILDAVATSPGFSERLAVDVARLRIATGAVRGAGDYLEAAQLSLQDGFPMEASRIIDQGYAAGLLGTGPEAERHQRLRDMTARNVAEDKKALARDAGAAPAAKDGKALLNEGFNHVLHGKFESGLSMMERGTRDAGSFRRPEHAKLQLAYAYHLAGQNRKAIQVYKSVQGTDGAAALARLWVIRLGRAS